jgi:hypothetical protein
LKAENPIRVVFVYIDNKELLLRRAKETSIYGADLFHHLRPAPAR